MLRVNLGRLGGLGPVILKPFAVCLTEYNLRWFAQFTVMKRKTHVKGLSRRPAQEICE